MNKAIDFLHEFVTWDPWCVTDEIGEESEGDGGREGGREESGRGRKGEGG